MSEVSKMDIVLSKKNRDEIEKLQRRAVTGAPMDSTDQLILVACKLAERIEETNSSCTITRDEAKAIMSFVDENLLRD